jgi:site-specific DNA-methyltransferase (adenine-specific)
MDVSLELHNGDCLEIMKTIPDKSVDLILCDLPYGCLNGGGIATMSEEKRKEKYHNNTGATIHGCAWDVKIDLEKFWKQVKRIRKSDHSPCIHFCTTKFGYDLIKSNEKEFRYDLVWDKKRGVSFLSANRMPMRSHEMIYVFAKAGAYYERVDEDAPGKGQRTDGASKTPRKDNMFGNGLKMSNGAEKDKACVKTVIQLKKVGVKTQKHPTEKPAELYQWLIERYCPRGGTVLDPTMGSANSVFTAYDMNRSAIGIEKDLGFYNKAVARLGVGDDANDTPATS